ncbi:hypothetical protein [Mangrovicella endophytica]|uniref:hypothetical protein n=1 Tax=Mangrovicella endophytica TaxID=2066697 RepID=UPI000C9E235B|nr:hypothetical protein [Mangrovicella endophytica]
MDRRDEDERNQREARAILERVRQETEPQLGAGVEHILTRARAHLSAADVDPADRVEVLGTRIGRILGVVGFIVLALLLVMQLSQF